MTDLLALSNRAERAAVRKLAAQSGLSQHAALLRVLTEAAGAAGLEELLAARRLLRAQEATRKHVRALQREALRDARQARHHGNSEWHGWFDGSARPNPGRLGIGAVLRGPHGQTVEISRQAGEGCSSEAEYHALIALLEAARQRSVRSLTVYGDSQVVITDMSATGRDTAPALAHLRAQAQSLLAQCGDVVLRWVPRHRNPEADALSQRAAA